jgi:ribosomal protein S18 acetylase RimI-like enzyme
MGMNSIIREATLEDERGLMAIFEQVDALHRRAVPHIFQKPDRPAWTRELISAFIKDENTYLLVAENNGEIVGFALLFIRQAPPIPIMVPRRYAIVENLAVTEKCQRQGIGRSLMEAAENWAIDQKLNQIELNVWEFNQKAIAFYKRLGYRAKSWQMWKDLK